MVPRDGRKLSERQDDGWPWLGGVFFVLKYSSGTMIETAVKRTTQQKSRMRKKLRRIQEVRDDARPTPPKGSGAHRQGPRMDSELYYLGGVREGTSITPDQQ